MAVYPNVPESDAPGTLVTFSDASVGEVAMRAWTFDDGLPATSIEPRLPSC
ncbi:MAG: hypothetical protein H0U74_22340 [Bradymonadaceae bacterium]|nr:hypothetical protein [Lujinxingiaceae bacterium]